MVEVSEPPLNRSAEEPEVEVDIFPWMRGDAVGSVSLLVELVFKQSEHMML